MTIEYDQIERLEALLAERNARIAELEAQVATDEGELEIARRLIRDLQGKKDETALMAAIDDLMKQVKDLKEIAVEEVAIRIAYENNMSPVECREYSHCQAHRQLSEEHPEAFV